MKAHPLVSIYRFAILLSFALMIPMLLNGQELKTTEEGEIMSSINKKKFSAEVNYNWNTREIVRKPYTEYPELALRYRLLNKRILSLGMGCSAFYYTYNTSDRSTFQYNMLDIKPHAFLEFKLGKAWRPWIAIGDRITKTYIKQVQPSSPLITTSVLGGTLAHRLNISSGLAVDLTRYIYVQFQVDETFYYEQIKTDIKELRTDVYLKLGVGIRI